MPAACSSCAAALASRVRVQAEIASSVGSPPISAGQRRALGIVGDGDRQPVVLAAGGIDPVRRHARVGVAHAGQFRSGCGHQQRLADQRAGNLACGDIDQRALAGGAAAVQRRHRRDRGVHPDGVVHDMAHLDRRPVGEAGELGQAAPGAEQRRVAGKVRIRPLLPEEDTDSMTMSGLASRSAS